MNTRNEIRGGTFNGPTIQAGRIAITVVPQPPEPPPQVLVGRIPAEATAFQPRAVLRAAVDRAHENHGTVVLTQLLAGGGGVGKTQLAAHYARRALAEGTDLVLWADASEPQNVTALYARAAGVVHAPGAGGRQVDAEHDAACFLSWLATTERSWLVVLDNATELDTGRQDLWPDTAGAGSGRVLATTRRRDAAASGAARSLVDVGVYSPAEAIAYLRERLGRAGCAHLLDDTASALVEALGHLPLALGHAAAYLVNTRRTSGRYLELFRRRATALDRVLPRSADADGYGRAVATSLLLALDAAQREEPRGLAVPAIRLAAHLDPAGHPRSLWSTAAVAAHLARHRTDAEPDAEPSVDDVLDVLAVLHNYSLLTDADPAGPRSVAVHALTARAARESAPDSAAPGLAAADALLELWPQDDHGDLELTAALRANADTVRATAGEHLWRGEGHPVLFRAGNSLLEGGLPTAATSHWADLATTSERLLGPEHPGTLSALAGLGAAHRQAGRTTEAIDLLKRVAADHRRLLGPRHTDTLVTQANLAATYEQADRIAEATALLERVLGDYHRSLGPDDPLTLTARANLAACYARSGRTAAATAIEEQVLADRLRVLGPDHPHTLITRANLATSYWLAGRTAEAIAIEERVLADRLRLLGPDHPSTLTVGFNLAASYRQAGRATDAVDLLARVLADTERVLGPEHAESVSRRRWLAVMLTERALAGLPAEVGGALRDAARAIETVEPGVADHPEEFGPVLRAAYRLTADLLDHSQRPLEAADFRQRADRVPPGGRKG
ncbi:tetratricopeptide repeat protein [Kitasatospora sp. NPDC088346]|uniref:tetratricopeptide repeat protein n=1 Tax=Kitasatospora sp. NPDC088346 TaxID=3364073 RepID=UPI00382AC958